MGRTTNCITWLSSPTSMWKWQKIDPFLQRCPCKTTSAGKTWLPLCGLTNCTVLWSLVGGCPWHHLRKSDTNTKSVTLNKKIQPVGVMIWKQSIRLKVKVARSCPTLCDPMDCSPPGSSVHGILQARIPKWAAISLSRGSSWPRDWTQVSYIAGRFFTIWATKEAYFQLTTPYLDTWMLRPSSASLGKLQRETHFGWNGKNATLLFQNTQLLEMRWAKLHGDNCIDLQDIWYCTNKDIKTLLGVQEEDWVHTGDKKR